MSKNQRKQRIEFRKNRTERTRITDWTKKFESDQLDEDEPVLNERISGKGDLVRKRTVIVDDTESVGGDDLGFQTLTACDTEKCMPGRVLRVHGLLNFVEDENGVIFQCTTRRILRTMQTDQRHVVVAGDRVLFRTTPNAGDEGVIERVEPRSGTISRMSKNRKHLIVSNVDQALIIASAAEPVLKPNLIDRILITAERAGIKPIICINKIDLVDPVELQPIIGVYAQMGYKVIPLSATTGFGFDRLKRQVQNRESVVTGQSGVGKSSILNRLDPDLQLRVAEVSRDNQKGKHTTTTAELLKLSFGGYVVDTPGIRQFTLWDIIPDEVLGFYRDLRPYENHCKFPNCTHSHEADCAVKNAVADGRVDARRYESFLGIRSNE
ncbi:MAG: ribosome small subunit-dependent GTPase A [Thermoguttaceae bacterium]